MNSPRLAIGAFVLGVLGALLALAWVTVSTLRLETREADAQRQNRLNEAVRLVLWRMDSALTPIIAREAARPYFEYDTFYQAPRVRSLGEDERQEAPVLSPSPLIRSEDHYAMLYYQRFADGRLVSPQAPGEPERTIVAGVYTTDYDIIAAEQSLKALSVLLANGSESPVGERERLNERELGAAAWSAEALRPSASTPPASSFRAGADPQAVIEYRARQQIAEQASNVGEFARAAPDREQQKAPAPARRSQLAADSDALSGIEGRAALPADMADLDAELDGPRIGRVLASGPAVVQGAFAARWIYTDKGPSPELLLERTVSVGEELRTQGVWLNWPEIKALLEDQAQELLPGATLRPFRSADSIREDDAALGRLLAAIPAELVLASLPRADTSAWSPARTTLLTMWVTVLLTLAIWALVLRAAMELAERRGRFVSAVTHELRTPLTTFCLYSQMLADGLVREESARQVYFNTLKTESQRLARIVESVLDYARLSGKRPSVHTQRVSTRQLVEALRGPMVARCDQSGMQLVLGGDTTDESVMTTDPALVERIVLNLVDNACKYASQAQDRRVLVHVASLPQHVIISVRDHGPGIASEEAQTIFRPFVRGRGQSHGGVPGLGLGLAIAHSLCEEIGGELEAVSGGDGGHFRLTLPRAAQSAES
jgi:signal transduction histidine kinase